MKASIFLAIICCCHFAYSQNIGISTTTPTAKFQINSQATFGRPTLKLFDSSTVSGPTIEFQNASSANYWQMGGRLHATDPTQSFFEYFTNTKPFIFSMRGDGRIGMGTPNPQAKLHIFGDESNVSFALFNNSSIGGSILDGLLVGSDVVGHAYILNHEPGYLFLGTAGAYRMSIASSGAVGIGIADPLAALHVRGLSEVLRVEGESPYVSFFDGAAYKGYLWYYGGGMSLGTSTNEPVVISANYNAFPAYFTPSGGLGLGISNPSERLDVNGNINLNGLIKVNGNSGTMGQVLTSNGAADPSWTNAALTNNIRFAVEFVENPAGRNSNVLITATAYNLNPTAVVIGPASITINRSGLYHFDIGIDASVSFASAPLFYPSCGITFSHGVPTALRIIGDKLMQPTGTANTTWRLADKVSVELYISAGTTISLTHLFLPAAISSYNLLGFMTGHLISE